MHVLTQLGDGVYSLTVERDEVLLVRFEKNASPVWPWNPKGPKTGDDSGAELWTKVMAGAGLGLLILVPILTGAGKKRRVTQRKE